MVSCVAAAAYVYNVDILSDSTTIDPETYETIHSWKYLKTVPGFVFPYLDGGIRGSGSTERFDEKYSNSDYLRIKTSKELGKRWRLTNIRTRKGGRLIYQEGIDGTPTVYNIDGSAPIINTLTGGVDEWLTTLSRAEVQGNG